LNILVTGAAGFVGAAVCRELLEAGHSVIGVDPLTDDLYPALVKRNRCSDLTQYSNFRFVERSMEHESIRDCVRDSNVVINEAALPGLALSWTETEKYFSANVLSLRALIGFILEEGSPHLVHASTSSVYGATAVGKENQALAPVSPYGVSKLAAEALIAAYESEADLLATVLRYFSVYGPGQRPDMAYERFCRAIVTRQEITITGDGEQSRSNTYIADVVDATVRAAVIQPKGLVANIAGDETISMNQAIKLLAEFLNETPHVHYVPRTYGDQTSTQGDASLAKRLLGWKPKTSISEGLRAQALSFRAQGR